jgi:Right handed beta helix region
MRGSQRLHARNRHGLAIILALGLAMGLWPPPRTEGSDFSPIAIATTYYVQPAGDDSFSGTSPGQAWKTLSRVNLASLSAGARVLLAGGAIFSGSLRFGPDDRGTPKAPITIGSFGAGRAVLSAGKEPGISVYDTGGFVIRDLVVSGMGRTTNRADGIAFINDLPGDAKLAFIRVQNVEVSGFGETGIAVRGARGRSGYRDVRIVDSIARDNGRAGIWVDGTVPYANTDVQIVGVQVFNNSGMPGARAHTGDGMILGSVDGGLIERSVAHGNGWLCDTQIGGPVGIWTVQSRRITIQHNLSYQNRTGGLRDGGGFGLDGGVTESVLQYNRSFENDGAGYGLYHYAGALPWGSNRIRRNWSRDDGRKNGYGAITAYSYNAPMGSVEIIDNEIIFTGDDGPNKAIRFFTPLSQATVQGNTVASKHGSSSNVQSSASRAPEP